MAHEGRTPGPWFSGGLHPLFLRWLRRWLASRTLNSYLQDHPEIRAQMAFEVDHPGGTGFGVWMSYDGWPTEWKERLLEFFTVYREGGPLPLDEPLPLGAYIPELGAYIPGYPSQLRYRTTELARDTYLAQVAHVLHLETSHGVPWSLADYTDHERLYLLSSRPLFSARTFESGLHYVVKFGDHGEATENILHDPRKAYEFMVSEPEEGRCLLGDTMAETCSRLSEWLHDYLWHCNVQGTSRSEVFDIFRTFYREHPLLTDRLVRHSSTSGDVYIALWGCGSASSLFADLTRSVNIPVRKVENNLLYQEGEDSSHSGLAFRWMDPDEARFLLHTDDLYHEDYFRDPAPNPVGISRGSALWDHCWLGASAIGDIFELSSDVESEIFAVTTWENRRRYREQGKWLIRSAGAVVSAGYADLDGETVVSHLTTHHAFSQEEAEAAWTAVEETLLAYGEGDLQAGHDALVLGPDSRHCKWCNRTGKCFTEDPCMA